MIYWYDGQLFTDSTVALPINDPALLYGATVFTTLRVYEQDLDHELTQWHDHCYRLESAIAAFHWQQPNWQRVRAGAQKLSHPYSAVRRRSLRMTVGQQFPVLRITIFSDGRELILGRKLPTDLAEKQEKGITAWLATEGRFQRSFPNQKTGNYLGSWLALQTAKEKGAQEAILVDEQGNWLETSTGNLWGWKEGSWWTPPVNQALAGIARSRLLSVLKQRKIRVHETIWTPEFVESLEALGYSNCVVQVIPIHTVIV